MRASSDESKSMKSENKTSSQLRPIKRPITSTKEKKQKSPKVFTKQ